MSTLRSLPALVSLALGTALLATAVGGPVMGGKGDRKNRRQQQAEETLPAAAISTIKGDRYRIGGAKIANRLTRVADDEGDQLDATGVALADAPAWTDLASVSTAPFRFSRKMRRSVLNAFPRGTRDTFYGPDADWSVNDTGLFVLVELAEPRPDDVTSQVVEIGYDGGAAGPVRVGSGTDTRAGVQTFTLAGRFTDGSDAAGTTDVSGRAPGEPITFYNARSGIWGMYQGQGRYYFLLPEPRDARAVAVSLRSTTDQGEVIDRLELPGGGHLLPLDDPGLGFKAGDGAEPLACRAIATAATAPTTADGAASEVTTMIHYTAGVGMDAETGAPADATAALAALDGLGSVPLRVQRLDEDAEPLDIEAPLSLAPVLGAFTLTIDVPPGTWAFEPADADAFRTPAGEALIDHRTLSGRAGVRTGAGLVGFVSGDPGCGRWDIGGTACSFVPDAAMEAIVPTSTGDLEQVDIAQPDGSAWCVGRIPGTREGKYIVRVGRDHATTADLEAAVDAVGCAATPIDMGRAGQFLDCAASGNFERYLSLIVPEATTARDPAAGLLVSIDMAVDPGVPAGERYDGAAALTLFGTLAADLAASVTPGGAVAPTDAAAAEPTAGDAEADDAATTPEDEPG